MAPTTADQIERQTTEILKYLFDDEESHTPRQFDNCIETDGPEDDSFDPVLIADKLRTVADALNEDVKFKTVLTNLKQAAAQEAIDQAFSTGVEAVCQASVFQTAEVAPEIQLLKASVAFGLYVTKSYPELKNKVQNAMAVFLNRRVEPYVAQQGGWNKVSNI
ncbi:hypothetical protein D5F01_LYC02658 [Scomber scombrus]|uniref:Bcl-2-like protein 15 n=1 Tax=Scomber scombrus TaxID=13677 RepID=A0AAV1N8V6_SCOSC